MSSDPYISVIINAYNRRFYVEKAIKSVLNQTLDREKYEVIVVSNFEINVPQGVKLIYEEDRWIGKRYYTGIEEAKGEVISFLDDDDEFVEDKLSYVYKYFNDDNNLGFYHNSQVFIDKDSQVISYAHNINHYLVIDNRYDFKSIKSAIKYGGTFNNSSMSVRREILKNFKIYGTKIKGSFDEFLFYISLFSNRYKLAIDNKILTRYRKHDQNVSSVVANLKDPLIELSTFKETLPLIYDLCKESSITPKVCEYIECEICWYYLFLNLLSVVNDTAFNKLKKSTYHIFKCRGKIGYLSLISLIDPELAKKILLKTFT